MRPTRSKEVTNTNPNLPFVDGRYVKLADHTDDLVSGFRDYTGFLLQHIRSSEPESLYKDFAGLPVRKVIRATRFYSMLLQRLKNTRSMDDGILWSAQADFMARLAEWDKDSDDFWPLQRAERCVTPLNVPHFVSGDEQDSRCKRIFRACRGEPRAQSRARTYQAFDEKEIGGRLIIRKARVATSAVMAAAGRAKLPERPMPNFSRQKNLRCRSDRMLESCRGRAIRRGAGCCWIGLDWLGDAGSSSCLPGAGSLAAFPASRCFLPPMQRWPNGSLSPNWRCAGIAHLRRT